MDRNRLKDLAERVLKTTEAPGCEERSPASLVFEAYGLRQQERLVVVERAPDNTRGGAPRDSKFAGAVVADAK
jgi:hypothetical protein